MKKHAVSSKRAAKKTKPTARCMPICKPKVVHVVSDSTGNLARHMLTALLTQFPPGGVVPQYHNFVRTSEELDEVVDAVKAMPGAVCHAVVAGPLKRRIADFCRASKLPQHDLTGALTRFLAG